MSTSIVAALQIGSSPAGKAETLEHILSFEGEITAAGASLVVMPEALLGGYPKGQIFGTRLGYRLPEGREAGRSLPATTPTPLTFPARRPMRWPSCPGAPAPAWFWV